MQKNPISDPRETATNRECMERTARETGWYEKYGLKAKKKTAAKRKRDASQKV